jgi:maleate isomerase
MVQRAYRIGQIVPSSNITMETEIPAMLNARQEVRPERFTMHASRMRMREVTAEQLRSMDSESDRCAAELSDARVDVFAYACLVAIMSRGAGYHRTAEQRLRQTAMDNGASAPVVSSAGALIAGLDAIDATSVALIAPYQRPLTEQVVDYIAGEGHPVTEFIALEITDNLAVGARDPLALDTIVDRLDHTRADAVILSACVQMPSLAAIQIVQDRIGKPVLSAAVATTYQILRELDLETYVPNAGELLNGKH